MTGDGRPHWSLDLESRTELGTCLRARGLSLPVEYVETVPVTDGVTCDVYRFPGDDAYDLAVVEVRAGRRTPRQRVLSGTETVEGRIAGRGTLTVSAPDGEVSTYGFHAGGSAPVPVEVGEVMQWHADTGDALVFFELCSPPYAAGRFEDLADC